jgi:hypothetical protein
LIPPAEQREIILELLRTRNLGGGQQGVMEWRGSTKPESEIPLSGDHFKNAFGVAADGPDAAFSPTRESYSRRALEEAIEDLGNYDHKAYIAINGIFDRDVGGYRDLEFFTQRAPELAADAERGIWILTAMLHDKPLYVEFPRPMTPHEETQEGSRNRAVYDTWVRRKAEGARSMDVIHEIQGTYGISERRVYQILDQMTPPADDEPEKKPKKRGRPKKKI